MSSYWQWGCHHADEKITAVNDNNVKWLRESLGDMASGKSKQSFLIGPFGFLRRASVSNVHGGDGKNKSWRWNRNREKGGLGV